MCCNGPLGALSLTLIEREGNVAAGIEERLNVHRVGEGPGAPPMIFSHGFGCDQRMWRFVAPAFAVDHDVVLYDHVGASSSNVADYDPVKYSNLRGYAADLVELVERLELRDAVFVGHSVAAMIGVVAETLSPGLFSRLVLVAPSARYIDDPATGYVGGFSSSDIEEMLMALADNHLGWSAQMAGVIMGNPDRPELAAELENSFCQTDPSIAEQFARVTFTSDNREDLRSVATPCLILQCSADIVAPEPVGRYLRDHLSDAVLVQLAARGHCPQLSAPVEVISAMRSFLG